VGSGDTVVDCGVRYWFGSGVFGGGLVFDVERYALRLLIMF